MKGAHVQYHNVKWAQINIKIIIVDMTGFDICDLWRDKKTGPKNHLICLNFPNFQDIFSPYSNYYNHFRIKPIQIGSAVFKCTAFLLFLPYVTVDTPPLTRVCRCTFCSKPMLPEQTEPYCLQFRKLPLNTGNLYNLYIYYFSCTCVCPLNSLTAESILIYFFCVWVGLWVV